MLQTPVDDSLFEEFRLAGLELENSVGLSPMTRISATESGRATDEMAEYYARFARGGSPFSSPSGSTRTRNTDRATTVIPASRPTSRPPRGRP